MSALLQIFNSPVLEKQKEFGTETEEIVDPIILWNFLLDKNTSTLYGTKNLKRKRKCSVAVADARNAVTSTLKFVFRFVATMGLFYLCAYAFAYLEHHEEPMDIPVSSNRTQNINRMNYTIRNSTEIRSFFQSADFAFEEEELDDLTAYVEATQRRRQLSKSKNIILCHMNP